MKSSNKTSLDMTISYTYSITPEKEYTGGTSLVEAR